MGWHAAPLYCSPTDGRRSHARRMAFLAYLAVHPSLVSQARQCTSLSWKTFHHLPGGKHDVRSAFKDERMHLHQVARILCVFLPRRGPYSRHSCFRNGIHKWEGSSRHPPDVMGLHCSTVLSASVFNSKFSTELTLRSSATPAALFAAI